MALNKDYIFYWIEALTGKKSKYTGTCQTKKKFSDVVKYIREGKFLGKSTGGQVTTDSDVGTMFIYRYLFNGQNDQAGYYEVTVSHYGETIKSMEAQYYNPGAANMTKKAFEKMEAALEDFDGKAPEVMEEPKIDYSDKSIPELLDILDKKIQEFKVNANVSTFKAMDTVKEELDKKIGQLSLDKRGAYSAPMSNLNMYFDTLRTQLANPMIDVKQFVGTYVPQMTAALAEMASIK